MTLRQLLSSLRKHLIILIVMPLCLGFAAWITVSCMPKTYTVQSTMYAAPGETTPFDRDTSSVLMYLANGGQVWDSVANLHPEIDISQYSIDAYKSEASDVIVVEVSGPDVEGASAIANEAANYTCSLAIGVLNESNAEVLTLADGKALSSKPNTLKYAIEFGVLGLFAAIAVIIIRTQKKSDIR